MTFRRAALLLALAAFLPSCGGGGGGGGGGPTDSFNRQALLTNLAATLVMPTLAELETKVQALKTALDTLATDVGDTGFRDDAKLAWKEAMDVVQVAELLQFGPAGSSTFIAGGQNLRFRYYSWPFRDACLVDSSEIVNPSYPSNVNFYENASIEITGLEEVEYLLFHGGPDNACTPQIGAPWTNLGQATIDQRRADYAAYLAGKALAYVQQLQDQWDPAGANFLAKFNAAAGSGVYASAHAAVNDVFGAMFYLDSIVKDKKLSAPAGISSGLAPDALLCEAPWAIYSKENVLTNLRTFQVMFLGHDPADVAGATDPLRPGFDDFLAARGAGGVATTMAADITEAIAAVTAIPGAIETAILDPMTGLPAVVAAHAAIRDITNAMKTTFVSALGLTVPATGAGDTD
jgi:predicted lipoprotein